MSMLTCKLLDGYALNSGDGYTVYTDWQDVHSSPFFSISVVFSGSNPDGYVSLQCSNDQSSDEVPRGTLGSLAYAPVAQGVGLGTKNYPVRAGSPQGTPPDANTVSGSNTLVTTTSVVTYNTQVCGYRWVRVVWSPVVDTNTTIDVWMHRKSQIARVG